VDGRGYQVDILEKVSKSMNCGCDIGARYGSDPREPSLNRKTQASAAFHPASDHAIHQQ
jgi:hypothetical protein